MYIRYRKNKLSGNSYVEFLVAGSNMFTLYEKTTIFMINQQISRAFEHLFDDGFPVSFFVVLRFHCHRKHVRQFSRQRFDFEDRLHQQSLNNENLEKSDKE